MASTFTPARIRAGEVVENRPIRDALERIIHETDWTWREIAEDAGTDVGSLRRRLGYPSGGRSTMWIDAGFAGRVVRAVGFDPVDFDV